MTKDTTRVLGHLLILSLVAGGCGDDGGSNGSDLGAVDAAVVDTSQASGSGLDAGRRDWRVWTIVVDQTSPDAGDGNVGADAAMQSADAGVSVDVRVAADASSADAGSLDSAVLDLSCNTSFGREEACGGELPPWSEWELVGACLDADLAAGARNVCPGATASALELKHVYGFLIAPVTKERAVNYVYTTVLTAEIDLPADCVMMEQLGGCDVVVGWALEVAMHKVTPFVPARLACAPDGEDGCKCAVHATWNDHRFGGRPLGIDADNGILTFNTGSSIEAKHDYCIDGNVLRHRRQTSSGDTLSYVLRRTSFAWPTLD